MRFFRHGLLGLALAAVTLGLLALAAGSVLGALRERAAEGPSGAPAEELVVTVRVLPVTASSIVPRINAFGEIRARRMLELRAPRSGRIDWVAPGLTEGAVVAAGATLILLDKAEAEATLALALADLDMQTAAQTQAATGLGLARDALDAAEAQVTLRKTALDRQRDLLARGAGSASAVESAELAEASARQGVVSARQALLAAEADLSRADAALRRQDIPIAEARRAVAETEITARFAGVLTAVTVIEGGLVGANERLAVLIDPASLDVWVRVSTAQFGRLVTASGALGPGEIAVRMGNAPGAVQATGRIDKAGAAQEAGDSGRLIIASLTGASGLRPGDFVEVSLNEPPIADAARIPSRAVGADGQVLVLGPEDRLQGVPVTVLRRQGNDVIIAAGALAGREIVSERTPQVGAGIRVRALRTPQDAAMVALNDADRARLIAMVEADATLSDADRAALLGQLTGSDVPAGLVARLNARAGG